MIDVIIESIDHPILRHYLLGWLSGGCSMIVEAGAMVALGDVSHGHSKEITCTRCRITNKVLKWLMFASFFSFFHE